VAGDQDLYYPISRFRVARVGNQFVVATFVLPAMIVLTSISAIVRRVRLMAVNEWNRIYRGIFNRGKDAQIRPRTLSSYLCVMRMN